MTTIGFIGTGNMGSALAKAAVKSGLADRILLANRTREKAEKLREELGTGEVCDNETVVREADYIFLGVKPHLLNGVMEPLWDILDSRTDRYIIVSMVAGRDVETLSKMFKGAPIIRANPNIPTAVGSGILLYHVSDNVREEEKKYFHDLMAPAGLLEEQDEWTMKCAGGVMGCGPAFAAMFVEALSDGAVACGLPRKEAFRYAAEMLKGTADVILQTGKHPGEIKDSVCSPAGSTIQGVRVLEERNFRAAVMDAVIVTFEKKF